MELRDYLAIVGRRLVLFLSVIVLTTGVFLAYGAQQKPSFTGLATITVIKKADQVTQPTDYRFDNFYTLQTNEGLAKQMAAWLADPESIRSIYDAAHVGYPNQSLTRYDKALKTKPLGAGVLEITTTAATATDAQNLAAESTKAIHGRLQNLMDKAVLGPIDITESQPLSEAAQTSLSTLGLVGLVVGIIFGLILVFFVEYLKPSTKPNR